MRGIDEAALHPWLVLLYLGLALVTFLVLTFVTAPYGRHHEGGWGPTMPARWGWVVMESPAVIFFAWLFLQGEHALEAAPLGLFAMWQVHYVHRTFIFPFRLRAEGKRMPVLVAGIAFVYQLFNVYVVARYVSHLHSYPADWVSDPRFLVGVAVFVLGFVINTHADTVLIQLREPGETGYKLPRGGLYEHVTCPNYLGELLEWVGFAIASWSLAGLAFAVYTAANLVPRALANRRWYRERFEDYPADRKALIPGLL